MALARYSLVAGVATRWQIFSGEVAGFLRADGKVVPVFAAVAFVAAGIYLVNRSSDREELNAPLDK